MNFVAGLALLFAVLALAWMILLPHVMSSVVRERTGFVVSSKSFYINPFGGTLRVDGMTVANPPDFPRPAFLTIPEVQIEANPASLLGSQWRIDDAVVHVAEVALVRDARGRLNARLFAQGFPALTSAAPARILIKRLDLRVDRLEVAVFDRDRPEIRTVDIHYHHTFSDVTDLHAVAASVIATAGRDSPESGKMAAEASSLLHTAGARLENAGRRTGETVKGLIESLEKSLRK